MSDQSWSQASLPIHLGGLGIRSVTMLVPSAFLASTAGTSSMVLAILPPTFSPPRAPTKKKHQGSGNSAQVQQTSSRYGWPFVSKLGINTPCGGSIRWSNRNIKSSNESIRLSDRSITSSVETLDRAIVILNRVIGTSIKSSD